MKRRALRVAIVLVAVAVAGASVLLADHNIRWRSTPRAVFMARLDQAIERGTGWVVRQGPQNNAALMFMVADMARMSGDSRLREVVRRSLNDVPLGNVWRRMADRSAPVAPISRDALAGNQDYQRWFQYALAPADVDLAPDDRAAMFAPDRYVWGSRTHQLLAVMLYRDRVSSSPEVQALVNHLCEGIAAEARLDVRVTDLYLQRLAFIAAAGLPELIAPRWVERAIAAQRPEGGWVGSWHGWGPDILTFTVRPPTPNSHSTVQGLWLLYLLKYRYPTWIDEHYP